MFTNRYNFAFHLSVLNEFNFLPWDKFIEFFSYTREPCCVAYKFRHEINLIDKYVNLKKKSRVIADICQGSKTTLLKIL